MNSIANRVAKHLISQEGELALEFGINEIGGILVRLGFESTEALAYDVLYAIESSLASN